MTTNTTGSTAGTTPPATAVKERAGEALGTAKNEAGAIAGTAKEQATQLAGTAKEQAEQVVTTTVQQSKHLLAEASDQLHAQATQQTQRLGENLRQVAQQLSDMAAAGQPGSTVTSLAFQAGEQLQRAAGLLQERKPGDLVGELTSYAKRRPGAFLTAAALGGFAIGRLATAARRASSPSPQGYEGYDSSGYQPSSAYGGSTYPAGGSSAFPSTGSTVSGGTWEGPVGAGLPATGADLPGGGTTGTTGLSGQGSPYASGGPTGIQDDMTPGTPTTERQTGGNW